MKRLSSSMVRRNSAASGLNVEMIDTSVPTTCPKSSEPTSITIVATTRSIHVTATTSP